MIREGVTSPRSASSSWVSGSGSTAPGCGTGISSVVRAEGESTDFADIQLSHIRTFRDQHPAGRVSQGLVVIPTDSATATQRARYAEYAARRLPRTREPQGPARMLFSQDYVGTSDEIAERLLEHAAYQEVDEVAFALPFTFEHEDYVQILTDIAEKLGPVLGWQSKS